MGGTPKMFVREATGLVKEMRLIDQFFVSIGVFNPMFAFVIVPLVAPAFFPGVYLPLVYVIGAIPAFAVAVVYAILSKAMPRSGGDYVWTTRIIGPLFGSIQLVFIIGTMIILGSGFTIVPAVSSALSQLFFSLAVTTNNAGLLSTASNITVPGIGFSISMVVLVVVVILVLLGLRTWIWFQRASFVVYWIVIAIFFVLPLTINPSTVPGLFDNAMHFAGSNATYSGIIQAATKAGYPTTGFNLSNTLLAAMPFGFLTYSGFNWSTYLAGETKNAKSVIGRSLYLTIIIGLLVLIPVTIFCYAHLGASFLNAGSYVSTTGLMSLPTAPSLTLLLSLTSPAVAVAIGIGLFVSFVIVIAGMITTMSRLLFAASFDRLLPSRLADVNDRGHSPHWAILLLGILVTIFLGVFWFAGSWASSALNTSIVLPIGAALPLISGLVFYFKKRDLYNRTVGSSPSTLIAASLIGTASFGFYIFAETVPISSGTFLGASLTFAAALVLLYLIVALAIYAYGRFSARRAGINLRQVYQEIPPE